jgi:RND family efflux transporter MFP subunit
MSPALSYLRTALRVLLPVAALGVAGVTARSILAMRQPADHTPPEAAPAPVEVVTVQAADHPAHVRATGTVQPSAQIDLAPQVTGRVVSIAEGLTPGSRFKAGDVIARLDARDFDLAVVQAESLVAQARLNLALEEARGQQADREWKMAGAQGDNPLAQRQPHLDAAQHALRSAEASLSAAKLARERTTLVAPFDCLVLSESLDVGQLIGPATPVARLIGTARFRVRVAIPVHEMSLIDIPGINAEQGSVAHVRQALGDGSTLEMEGRVMKALGELDAETRTAGVLVAVDQPFDKPGLPILPNAFVEVIIDGHSSQPTWEVPRQAVVEGRAVWIADSDDKLARREVVSSWGSPETLYVISGLQDGDRVITTPMALPIEGMPLAVTEVAARAD